MRSCSSEKLTNLDVFNYGAHNPQVHRFVDLIDNDYFLSSDHLFEVYQAVHEHYFGV